MITKFSLKLTNEGSLMFDADAVSNSHAAYAGTWTPSISTVHPMASTLAVIKYNGTASVNIDNIEIDYSQKYTYWYSGSRDYIAAYPGGREVKFKFDARFDTSAIYDDFVAGTQRSLEFMVTGANLGGTVVQTLDIRLPDHQLRHWRA